MQLNDLTSEIILTKTKEWVEKAVIGLNLCPFARAVYINNQIRYVISRSSNTESLLGELIQEMKTLAELDPKKVETTLLIHPQVLGDFFDYNDFLNLADQALVDLGLEGVLQVASFHPDYQFEGTDQDDITNYTNRSPFPTLHLLREESISKAVDSYTDIESVPDKNIETMNKLGIQGWKKLFP